MTDHDDIMAVEKIWNDVYLGGDVTSFRDMLLDDFVYSSERGVFAKEAYTDNLASGVIEMRNIESSDQEIRLLGDVAVVTGIARPEATFDGDDISGVDRYTRVWLRSGGTWRALAQHANQIPEEQRD